MCNYKIVATLYLRLRSILFLTLLEFTIKLILGRDLRDIQSRNSWIEADEVTFKDKLETKGDSDVSSLQINNVH